MRTLAWPCSAAREDLLREAVASVSKLHDQVQCHRTRAAEGNIDALDIRSAGDPFECFGKVVTDAAQSLGEKAGLLPVHHRIQSLDAPLA